MTFLPSRTTPHGHLTGPHDPPTAPALDSGAGDFMNTAAVAELLACTTRTVTRLIERGHLPATRLGPGGAYRIHPDALTAFVTQWGHHEPAEVATSTPGTLAAFAPREVLLDVVQSPDGLRRVRPHRVR